MMFYGDRNGVDVGEDGFRYHYFNCDEEHDGYRVEKVSGSGTINKIYGAYSNTCFFTTSGNTDGMLVRLYGKKVEKKEYDNLMQFNQKGETYVIENPLCVSQETAKQMCLWYYDYVKKGQTLTIDYRGDYALEPFDYIYVQSQYQGRIPVVITKTKLTYNGGLKGKLEVLNV